MDDRQRQVKIGAGLEESRVNQELLDWLGKWGPRILLVLLVIVAGYQGKRLLDQRERDRVNRAFVEFDEAVSFRNVSTIIQAGDDHETVGSLWVQSRLVAGEVLLQESLMGVSASAASVQSPTEDELLSDEEITERMERADRLYEQALGRLGDDPDMVLLRMQALLGYASTRLSLGEVDEAKQLLERAVALGEAQGYPDLAAVADRRLAAWANVTAPPAVYQRSELPASAVPDRVDLTGIGSSLGTPSDASTPRVLPTFPGSDGAASPPILRTPPAPTELPQSDEPNVPVRTIDPDDAPEDPGEAPAPSETPSDG